jgi:hypothetical protein
MATTTPSPSLAANASRRGTFLSFYGTTPSLASRARQRGFSHGFYRWGGTLHIAPMARSGIGPSLTWFHGTTPCSKCKQRGFFFHSRQQHLPPLPLTHECELGGDSWLVSLGMTTTSQPPPPLAHKCEVGVFLVRFMQQQLPHHHHHPLSLTNVRWGWFCLFYSQQPPCHHPLCRSKDDWGGFLHVNKKLVDVRINIYDPPKKTHE